MAGARVSEVRVSAVWAVRLSAVTWVPSTCSKATEAGSLCFTSAQHSGSLDKAAEQLHRQMRFKPVCYAGWQAERQSDKPKPQLTETAAHLLDAALHLLTPCSAGLVALRLGALPVLLLLCLQRARLLCSGASKGCWEGSVVGTNPSC